MTLANESGSGGVDQEARPRFTLWVAFFIFSTVALGSSTEVKNVTDDPSTEIIFTVVCSSITFACSIILVLGHFIAPIRSFLIGTCVEGILTFVLTGFWAATVAVVTQVDSPDDNFRVLSSSVSNGNLYYSSWAGFMTSVVLLVNYLKEAFGVDIVGEVHNRSARMSIWATLWAGSFIVIGSSLRILLRDCKLLDDGVFPEDDVVDDDDDFALVLTPTMCKRTDFAVGSGTTTCLMCMVVIGLKLFSSLAPLLIELVLGIALTVLNAFAVSYITSAKGPGAWIGNLYYSSWICFLASALLTAEALSEKSNARDYNASSSGQPAPKADDDIEMSHI